MERKLSIWIFDVIKPVAATLIVFHHYQQVFKCEFSGINFYSGLFNFGYLVELFFMISGFLTLYTFKECAGGSQLLKCFCHKLKRVFPVVTIACIYTLLIKTLIHTGSFTELSALWNIKTLVANFLLLFSGYPFFSMTGYNNPTWYIAILIQCYAVFYILKYITNKLHIKFLFTVSTLIIVVIVLKELSLFCYDSFRGFESFFIGVIVCDLAENQKAIVKKVKIIKNKKLLTILLSITIIITFSSIFIIPKYQRIALVFGVYPEIVIISYLYRNVRLNSKVCSAFKLLCGISFEVYIWHYPFMATIQLILQNMDYGIAHGYFTMAIFTLAVWLICLFIYRFIEQPINKFIKTKEKAKINNEQKLSNNRS